VRTLWKDIQYGWRMLTKSASFTIIAVLTLGLGVGANTAVFSVINGLFLKPLPGKDNASLMAVAMRREGQQELNPIAYLDYREYRAKAEAFSDMAAYANELVGLRAGNHTERALVQNTTGNFFEFLGLQPAMGRLFRPEEGEDLGSEQFVVLGYRYWKRRFDGSPSVIGMAVEVNGKPCTIIGVAPEELIGPFTPVETDAYLTLGLVNDRVGLSKERGRGDIHVFARPKPGVGLAQARASLNVVAAQLEREYPATNKGLKAEVAPERLARPEPDASRTNPVGVAAFLIMVGLVLLITCVNVANLVLVRASTRYKEIAIRASLGAGRGRIFRQLLTESLLLSGMGGAAGALLGAWFTHLIGSIRFPTDITLHLNLAFDWRVFLYTGVIALACGITVGLVPAWRASRMNLNAVLRESGRSGGSGAAHQRMRSALVIAQVAGTLVVLVIAGLFARSLQSTQHMELGFNPDHVLNLGMDPAQIGYDEARATNLFRAIKERTRAVPGVQAVSFAFSTPFGVYNSGSPVWKENEKSLPENEVRSALYNRVDEDYFQTLQIPIVRGRAFSVQDQPTSLRVAIINETLAKQLWPGEDPIGHHFSYLSANATPVEVVGVTRDGRYAEAMEDQRPYFYVPLSQSYMHIRVLHVRTTGDPVALAGTLQREVQALEPGLPLYNVQAMRESLSGVNGFFLARMGAMFASVLGMLGLALAVVGVYGVVSYAVALRTQEIGVRMAMGAQSGNVLGMILRQGVTLAGYGLLIGLALSFGVSRFLKSLLFQVSAADPVTYGVVSLLLLAITVVACYVPARRASVVDPLVALRYE
jgi:putative ABC transport system permease protein